jgi:hypothetical protein
MKKLEEKMSRDINISGVKGDVIGVGVEGTGHTFGKNITVGTININANQLKKMPNEYGTSLKGFSESVNEQLKIHKIPPEKVAPVQESINELAKEIEDVKQEEKISFDKKINIEGKFKKVVSKVLQLLPKGTEAVAAFTPLAPFSKLIGQGVQELVAAIQKEV